MKNRSQNIYFKNTPGRFNGDPLMIAVDSHHGIKRGCTDCDAGPTLQQHCVNVTMLVSLSK